MDWIIVRTVVLGLILVQIIWALLKQMAKKNHITHRPILYLQFIMLPLLNSNSF